MTLPKIPRYGWRAITKQEWLVIKLLVDAHNHESISNQLGVSIQTVKRHVFNICAKMRVNTSLQLVCKFYQELLMLQVADESKRQTVSTTNEA